MMGLYWYLLTIMKCHIYAFCWMRFVEELSLLQQMFGKRGIREKTVKV
jgi:hypothetical protein